MSNFIFLGADIGTSSSKAVAVDSAGVVLASAVREHKVMRPAPGIVEMEGSIWWDEFCSMAIELQEQVSEPISAVGVSGMGPCVLLTDESNAPTTPAALYGVDTRAIQQIEELNRVLGDDAIFMNGDSYLSTQSAGPKFKWFADRRPDAYSRSSRFHMPASFLVAHLTNQYVMDRQSASQSTPLYDAATQSWNLEWAGLVAPGISLPRLAWAGDLAGHVTTEAASRTGIPAGTPVTVGTIDAWAEGLSVGATSVGDLMLMYGTTMFMIANANTRVRHPALWGTTGLHSGQWNLAGGMATSGAITSWIRELSGGTDFTTLTREAEHAGPGARGLLMLPYFEGERTPIQDPLARGTITGLTISHTRGDLYRSALEATAYGVRHNLEAFASSGLQVEKLVAVGGGTISTLWPQIVTDVTQQPQVIREKAIGAALGDAFMAAALYDPSVSIEEWNPVREILEPTRHDEYEQGYRLYRELHERTRSIQHELASWQRDLGGM